MTLSMNIKQLTAVLTVKLYMRFVVMRFDMKTSAENTHINMPPFALCSCLLIIRQLLPHVTFSSLLVSSQVCLSSHSTLNLFFLLFSQTLITCFNGHQQHKYLSIYMYTYIYIYSDCHYQSFSIYSIY